MHINHQVVSPLLACCLIALDKCPGVRPIGIGDTSKCIMAKAILKAVKGKIQEVIGSKQLCTGQVSGVEAAIHTARECFLKEDTEAVFNIQFTCPELSTMLYNTYQAPSDLYIDGEAIPLIDQLPRDVTQIWYADDACAIGSLANLRAWWEELSTNGQKYGCYANASETWLVTK